MGISKFKKIYICLLVIFLIFSPVVIFIMGTTMFSNKTIEQGIITKENKYSLKTLDQEGQNYRLVTSADNVQVPVPKVYVASNITGENYVTPEYQHISIPHKGNYTQLKWSSPAGE